MRRPARRWMCAVFLTALAMIAMLLPARPAFAWGRNGHRASARLTEARLTPEALAGVRALLDEGESLADASTWADEVRRQIPASGPWHYVNVPITEPHYDARFCPKGGCVVSKIGDFQKVLVDREAPRAERQKALRFLIHFVQDLHQPLHVGDNKDRGGNDTQVRFFTKGANLHKVWDSSMLDRAHRDEAHLLARLTVLANADDATSWISGTTEDWADESLRAAASAYVLPKGSKLGEDYQTLQLPVAEKRLAQAGVRLAEVLNGVFEKGE